MLEKGPTAQRRAKDGEESERGEISQAKFLFENVVMKPKTLYTNLKTNKRKTKIHQKES